MDLNVFTPRELGLVLRALRHVALANDAFVQAEADLIEGLAALHGQTVKASALEPVAFAQVAEVLTDPHRRKRAVQLAIVISLVEGEPTPESADAVRRFALELGVSEEGLRVLSQVAEGHAIFARLHMVRRMNRFLHAGTGSGLLSLAVPTLLGLNEDGNVAARYRALGDLPLGTFGRAFYDHYRQHGFALPGEKGGMPENMTFHDIGHVFSGYGVEPQDEIQQAAFQAGFLRNDGFLFLLFGILQFHVGLRLTWLAKPEHGYFDVPKVLRALQRGAACKVDFSNRFELFAYASEPLDELRARWGIEPLEREIAAVA